ncbi:uncharacterized protein PV09_07936 [Verruconis gallopava]|uniref:3-oxoacyl-[acyl-carrier-protein] reductase n=1 Tax=Verruconis gallopava TaxID=253628 RepID=A0A0D2A1L0_9PEZI|nr:uncharacterized protein PV09_07936 [Verruconis gallopava]KIW00583.1 hypothetical protein PV09_07936 [Verruconis gallopava]
MSLAGKVALITGGTKGIGAAIAAKFVKEGAAVVVSYSADSAAAEKLVQELGADKVLAVQGDASKVSDLERLVKATVEKFKQIDVLIPNAGTMPMIDLEHLTEESYQRVMDVNTKGPIFLAQKAVPHMRAGSKILFVSTTLTAATNFTPGYLPYMASKGAIEQTVRVLAKDLASKGITVNAFAPGPTATDLFLKDKPEAVLNHIKSLNPFGKIGDPNDIADFVAMLASDGTKWLSGQTIRINGAAA